MTAAHLSVVIVVIGAGPLFVSLWRRARRAGDHGTLAALSLPFAAPVTFLVILAGVAALVDHSRTPGVGIGAAWFLVVAGLGLAAGAVCAAGPALALRRISASPAALRLAAFAAVPAIATMTVAVIASVSYSVGLHDTAPRFAAAVADQWLLVPYAVAMGAACLIAAVSTNRGLQVLRSSSGLA